MGDSSSSDTLVRDHFAERLSAVALLAASCGIHGASSLGREADLYGADNDMPGRKCEHRRYPAPFREFTDSLT